MIPDYEIIDRTAGVMAMAMDYIDAVRYCCFWVEPHEIGVI